MSDFCKCNKCGGSGKVPLPDHLQRIYSLLKERGELTTVDITQALNSGPVKSPYVSLSGCTNALTALMEYGLVSRESKTHSSGGRIYVYWITEDA